ncbi:MAG TPA: hypothetical protein ENJ60_16790 [Aeromonadales bacterium]|nr:hypothetical protein [Aeromonadales bacterium]
MTMQETNESNNPDIRPWFKEPWLWLVILLPVSAVVAGISTVIIANNNAVEMVNDDYYKLGLAINRNIDAVTKAKSLDIKGRLFFSPDKIQLHLQSNGDEITDQILLDLIHPTEKRLDKHFKMKSLGHGVFSIENSIPVSGRRYIRITSVENQWVIKSEINITTGETFLLSAK